MEKYQSLISALLGGALAWVGSYFSLKKQFENQLKINKIEEINEGKSAFLTLNDELEENRMVIQGYINFMNANDRKSINLKKDNINNVRDQAWKQVRERIFLSTNKTIVKEISSFYKGVYGMQNADLIPKELVEQILKDNINLKDKIVEHISLLEKSQ